MATAQISHKVTGGTAHLQKKQTQQECMVYKHFCSLKKTTKTQKFLKQAWQLSFSTHG